MWPLFTRFTAHLSAGLADITEEGLTGCFVHLNTSRGCAAVHKSEASWLSICVPADCSDSQCMEHSCTTGLSLVTSQWLHQGHFLRRDKPPSEIQSAVWKVCQACFRRMRSFKPNLLEHTELMWFPSEWLISSQSTSLSSEREIRFASNKTLY